LILDLEERGLLDETLVLCLTEHGRTPKLNNARGGGREHWSWAYCNLFAGGGIRQGAVIGATDREAGYPKQAPVSPKDVLCTIYHLLGVDPQTHLTDREGRPVPLVSGGEVVKGLLA
jgi:arylsulfatase A-like enzyme